MKPCHPSSFLLSLFVGMLLFVATLLGSMSLASATAAPARALATDPPLALEIHADHNPNVSDRPMQLTVRMAYSPPPCQYCGAPLYDSGASGTVSLFEGTQLVTSWPMVGGFAASSLPAMGTGSHTVRFEYSGNRAPLTSIFTLSWLNEPANPTLSVSSANPSWAGYATSFHCTMFANGGPATSATGTVTISEAGVTLASVPVTQGTCALQVPALPLGPHLLDCAYSGDGSTGATTLRYLQLARAPVQQATGMAVVTTPNPSAPLQTVRLEIALSINNVFDNSADGTVAVSENGVTLASAAVDHGYASLNVPGPAIAGIHAFLVSYSGDPLHLPKSVIQQQTVDLATGALAIELDASATERGIRLSWPTLASRSYATLEPQRSQTDAGPWVPVRATTREASGRWVVDDVAVESGVAYWYRLLATTGAGGAMTFGPVRVTTPPIEKFELSAAWPNPTRGPLAVWFALPRPSRARISLSDVEGREVALLAEGQYGAGRYVVNWDGRGEHGGVPPGLYFIHCVTPGGASVRRVVVAR